MLKNIKRWLAWHRWTSLICTLFLLMLCITGLPLIFGEELEKVFSKEAPFTPVPAGTPMVSFDKVVAQAYQRYPHDVINFMYPDDDYPQIVVGMLPDHTSPPKLAHSLYFDAHTGILRRDEPPLTKQPADFMRTMLGLHRDLFMGLNGELFLGLMGLLFVISLVTGAVLYGPYMKKLEFGTVRRDRNRRFKWLDLHNLLGIASLVWLVVVGATGVMNELATPLFGLFGQTDVKQMLAPYAGKPPIPRDSLYSTEAAYQHVKAALPGREATSVVFPGNPYGSAYHYLVWTKGTSNVTSRLFTPVLVDARTGNITHIIALPWYLRALEMSRPLHFGDYGGMPLKVIWALFDVVCIIVLASGVYLWFARRKTQETYFSQIEANMANG